MPITQCHICKKGFYAKTNWIKRGFGKYCSRKCQHESQKKGRETSCFICGKAVYKSLRELRHSKSGKYFCNKSCQTIWRNSILHTTKNHPNWKDGESSYRDIMNRGDTPQVCKRCTVTDKRILIVHHIDRDRKNNNLYNLIWLCWNCHYLVHHYKSEEEKFMETMV